MDRISESERAFIVSGVEEGLRADGRSRHDIRSFDVETGVAPQANGSARLRCAQSNTDVFVAVKLEIAEPKPQRPKQGYLDFAVDCAAVASTAYQGREVAEINSELTQFLMRLYCESPAVDLESLCIVEGAQCWVIRVDVLVLETGGNLLDHVCIAAKAALWDTQIPKVTVLNGAPGGAEGSSAVDIEVSDDPYDSIRFIDGKIDTVPVCVTLSRVGNRTIADAALEEEMVISAQLSVGVSPSGRIAGIQKRGTGAMASSVISEMLPLACSIGAKINSRLLLCLGGEGVEN